MVLDLDTFKLYFMWIKFDMFNKILHSIIS